MYSLKHVLTTGGVRSSRLGFGYLELRTQMRGHAALRRGPQFAIN
jgi:hypothetical protein